MFGVLRNQSLRCLHSSLLGSLKRVNLQEYDVYPFNSESVNVPELSRWQFDRGPEEEERTRARVGSTEESEEDLSTQTPRPRVGVRCHTSRSPREEEEEGRQGRPGQTIDHSHDGLKELRRDFQLTRLSPYPVSY